MNIPWNLTGTPEQIAIATEAFRNIKFPLDRLSLPGRPELGWADLNDGRYATSITAEAPREEEKSRAHGTNKHDGDKAHGLEGKDEANRRFTMGLIYTRSLRIYIDIRMLRTPLAAMQVIGMEFMHAVDINLMTDEQRNELLRMWNIPGTTWWETHDYSAEYFRLGGEAFMYEGLSAYSDYDLQANPFIHDAGVERADVHRILGIRRTDYVEPVAPPPPAPEPTPAPAPEPVKSYARYGKSKVYHLPTHYPMSKRGVIITDTTGLRPCKHCRP